MRKRFGFTHAAVVVGLVATGVGLSGAQPVAAGVHPAIAAWVSAYPAGQYHVSGNGFSPRGAVVIGFTAQDGSGRVDWFQVTASRSGSFSATRTEDCSTARSYGIIAWDRSTNVWSNSETLGCQVIQ